MWLKLVALACTHRLWQQLVRWPLFQRLYCSLRGIRRNCTETGHLRFAQRIGESAGRVQAVSDRGAYPRHAQIYYWRIDQPTQQCLLLLFNWHPHQEGHWDGWAASVHVHWLFYADGALRHSCILAPDNSRDKRTIIAFAERRDALDADDRAGFDALARDPRRRLDAALVAELCHVVKQTLLRNAEFSNAIDQTTFEPQLSLVHRTYLASEPLEWGDVLC